MTAVLAGLAEASGFDPRRCDAFVGTSAGSIVAAALVAGVEPRARLGTLPEQPPVATAEPAGEPGLLARATGLGLGAGATAAAPLAAVALHSTEAVGARLRRAGLRR